MFGVSLADFLRSGPVFSDYDGPNVDEVLAMLEFIRSTLDAVIGSGEVARLTRTALANLSAQLQGVNNTYTQLTGARDQNSFQNFAVAVDGLAYHVRMFGLPFIAAGGAVVEAQRNLLSVELATLVQNNKEVNALKEDVRTLITPAIAGSLSEVFTRRRDSIFKGRVLWGVVSIAIGGFAIYGTFDVANIVSAAMSAPKVAGAQAIEPGLWQVVGIRTVVLLPLFAAFGFAFSQYRKERDFEEEYAHKAAVANSLPNYGDLAREPAIRNQIVTAATTVIFSSPSDQARKAETSGAMVDSM